MSTLTGRERRLIRAMSMGERTTDLARRYQMSPGRVSQLRREFQRGWKTYIGDLPETAQR